MNFYEKILRGQNGCIGKILRIMKLTVIILTIAITQVSASSYAQKITLNLKNAPIERAFNAIRDQSGYDFFYSHNLIKLANPVSINVKDASLEEALKTCFTGQPFTYTIEEQSIVIKAKSAVSGINNVPEQQQSIEVYGKVLDETGKGLPGATIKVKGTTVGTKTDSEGNFRLKGVDEKAILVVSFLGYEPAEISAEADKEIIVRLHLLAGKLNDVVVIGYGTQSKKLVTGAIATVKMSNVLGDRPVSTTSSLMIGVVPGLQVSIPSGQPGSSTSFNVRGGTDLNTTGNSVNSGAPLILVDNVPFNGPLNLLNPNDIETLTVLKDAGSAAIYGGRSAFGVILITTKKAKKNQNVQFQYNNNVTFASATNLPVVANAAQFLQSLQDMGTVGFWSGQNVPTWQQLEQDYVANPSKYPGGIVVQGGVPYQLAPSNQIKAMLGSSVPQFQNNLSISGGSDKTTFRLSLGSVDQNGIIVPSAHQDNFTRYTVSSIVSTDVNKWLTAQLNANYYKSNTTTPSNNQFSAAVYAPPLIADTYTLSPPGGISGINALPKTLVATGTPNISESYDTRLTGRVILTPVTGLKVTGEYTYDNLQNNQTNYNIRNQYITPYNFQPESLGTGVYRLYSGPTNYKSLNVFGEYSRSLGNHNFNLLGGYNQE